MARRKKASPKRRSPKTVNAANLLESYLIANVATQTMFRVNPQEFLFNLNRAGQRGSNAITLPEIIGGISGTVSPSFKAIGADNLPALIKYNLDRSDSLQKLVVGVVGIPIAFRVGSKVLRKPRAQVNKVLRMTGLGVRV